MKCFAVFLVVAVATVRGGPTAYRGPRADAVAEQQQADVIRISDDKTPIVLDTTNLSENEVVSPRQQNETSSAPPSPVPDSTPITTEPPSVNTPSLVPSVVEVSTPDPNNTPPPPANNATTTPQPDEDEEESNEEGSEEEADEEDEEEGEEGDASDEEEEDDEEEDDEEEEDKARKVVKKAVIVKRQVNAEEVPSDEEEVAATTVLPVSTASVKKVSVAAGGPTSALQNVPARIPTGEDDEVDLPSSNSQSVIIS